MKRNTHTHTHSGRMSRCVRAYTTKSASVTSHRVPIRVGNLCGGEYGLRAASYALYTFLIYCVDGRKKKNNECFFSPSSHKGSTDDDDDDDDYCFHVTVRTIHKCIYIIQDCVCVLYLLLLLPPLYAYCVLLYTVGRTGRERASRRKRARPTRYAVMHARTINLYRHIP